jgi:hypothetical protein
MRRCVGVSVSDNRGDAVSEFVAREVLGDFGGEDERANLGAGSTEDDGVGDVEGGAESEFDRDGVGLFTIDLLGIELAIRVEWKRDVP